MFQLPTWAIFVATFLVAFAVTWVLTPVAGWLSRRYGFVALPGGRRQHEGAIPRLGGLPIFAGFMVAALLLAFPHESDANNAFRLTGLLLSATAIFIGGLLDDRFEFSALPQMAVTLVASLIAIRYWVFIERINNPFTNQPVVFPLAITIILTLIWMAGMVTTVNWMDGLDGLATGVSAIAVAVFLVHMLRTGQTSVALLPTALLGALLGFLPRNVSPARIFLGSTGAYFLGFTVAALAIIGGARAAMTLLVMGVPILDVAWQILHRLRHGRSPGSGDRGHLHFRLLDLGVPQKVIVFLYCAFTALLGGLALLIPVRIYKLLTLVGLTLFATLLLAGLTWLGERREGAESQRR